MYQFQSGATLLALCAEHKQSISEVMLLAEQLHSERPRGALLEEMRGSLTVMKQAVERGLAGDLRSFSGLSGGDAALLHAYAPRALLGEQACKAAAAAMATVEVNAAMGRIVAAPTAGASGILPGALITLAPAYGWRDEELTRALFTAGAIGKIIATRATISGAGGGCQAETGSAAAMTAAALVELCGGTPEMSLTAAAIALKNVLGLVCDPVAGLVECPCMKRNALGAMNALLAADTALCGIKSHIPFDEVVDAMKLVGASMRRELRETALGGLAATPTAKRIARALREKQGAE